MPKSFNDLAAFQRAIDLSVAVYEVTNRFPRDERYGLTAQLRRASISVCSNIAEGQGRLTLGEWRQMLSHARGSMFEIEAECVAAQRLGFLNDEDHSKLLRMLRRAGCALSGLIDWVKRSERSAKVLSNRATQQP
jgi:four helix bundle protein